MTTTPATPLIQAHFGGFLFLLDLTMKYTDPALTIDEQLARLKNRGLEIGSEENVKNTLTMVGYFRLNNYMRFFKKGEKFVKGTCIEDIVSLYEFDQFLRISLFEAIADIEVAVKAIINNVLACKYGPHWITNSAIFKPEFFENHQVIITAIKE